MRFVIIAAPFNFREISKTAWRTQPCASLCARRFCSFNEEKLQNRYSCGKAAASKIRRQDSGAPGFCGVGFSTIH
jgi:hypothetical protein